MAVAAEVGLGRHKVLSGVVHPVVISKCWPGTIKFGLEISLKLAMSHSGVVGRGVGTTWEGDSWVHVSRLEHRNAFKGLPYILFVARP